MGCCGNSGGRSRGRSRRFSRKILKFQEFNESREIDDLVTQSGVDMKGVDMDQLRMGIEEHDGEKGKDTDVVKKKTDLVKIAVAHLREDPKYYTKLKQVEGE